MIEYLPIVLTGIGIIVAIIYYTLTLRNANMTQRQQLETRQAQLFMQILNQFNQPSMVESRDFYFDVELSSFDDYMNMWSDPEKRKQHRLFGGFMEGIGVLVRENYLDIKVVAGLFGGTVKGLWEKHEPYIKQYREQMNIPRSWIEWEYLYNELIRYSEKHPELGIQETEHKQW